MVVICEKMGWTYYEYMEQPAWFLELLKEKMRLDSEMTARRLNRMSNK